MTALRAHVESGRLIVDDPIDLPDGTVLHVLPMNDGDDAERQVDAAWREEASRRSARLQSGEATTTPREEDRGEIFRRKCAGASRSTTKPRPKGATPSLGTWLVVPPSRSRSKGTVEGIEIIRNEGHTFPIYEGETTEFGYQSVTDDRIVQVGAPYGFAPEQALTGRTCCASA